MIPASSEGSFSRQDLLALMTEELQTYVVPMLMEVREEYLVVPYDVTTTTSQTYRLPPRAVGSKLRQVLIGPNETNLVLLQRVEPKVQYTAYNAPFGLGLGWNNVPYPVGYYFQNASIKTLGSVTAGQLLRMMYFLRPNDLVDVDECGVITAINTGTNAVTVNSAPISFDTTATYDFVRSQPGFETLGMDRAATTVVGDVVTFTATLPTDLVVGDYVCLAGQAPVAQVPVECLPLLTQRLVVKVLESLGDPKVKTSYEACELQRKQVVDALVSPRSEGDSRYVIAYKGPGWGNWRGRGGV